MGVPDAHPQRLSRLPARTSFHPLCPRGRCVFLPDNGAFFVNYVVTSSLIGTAMELLRIPGLLVYTARLCFAKSEPERLHVKRVRGFGHLQAYATLGTAGTCSLETQAVPVLWGGLWGQATMQGALLAPAPWE